MEISQKVYESWTKRRRLFQTRPAEAGLARFQTRAKLGAGKLTKLMKSRISQCARVSIILGLVLYSSWSLAQVPTLIQFASTNYSVLENAGQAAITITRSGNVTAVVSVTLGATDGTATAGADYLAPSVT